MASISSREETQETQRESTKEVSLESLQLSIDEATKEYIRAFHNMDSTQVMEYRWPNEESNTNSVIYDEEWIPMEYPIIPSEKSPAILSVAGNRKFNVLPFESDGFTTAVNAQRAGSGAPGLCGLGLTRGDRANFSSQTRPTSHYLSALDSPRKEGDIDGENSETKKEAEESTLKESLAEIMFKAAGVQLLSGSLKEEVGWRTIFKSCLAEGTEDPFENTELTHQAGKPSVSGMVLCDKVCHCDNTKPNEAVFASISHSPAMQALRDQPPLQDALVAINDGFLSPTEWIHFCEAVRDIVKWNDFKKT